MGNLMLRKLAFILVAVVLLVTGLGVTNAAAHNALPGDTLHPLKLKIEEAQLGLSKDAAQRALLRLQFAQDRLEELAGLVEEGRFTEISTVLRLFEEELNGALSELEALQQSDPQKAAEIQKKIDEASKRFAALLKKLAEEIPGDGPDELGWVIQNLDPGGGEQASDAQGNENENGNGNEAPEDGNSNEASNDNSDSSVDPYSTPGGIVQLNIVEPKTPGQDNDDGNENGNTSGGSGDPNENGGYCDPNANCIP